MSEHKATPDEARIYLLSCLLAEPEETLDMIHERFNCFHAHIQRETDGVAVAGSVYVGDPQQGHWLGNAALADLAELIADEYEERNQLLSVEAEDPYEIRDWTEHDRYAAESERIENLRREF